MLVITTPNIKSLYGFTKIVFDLVGKILNIFRKKRKVKKHPYDVWKTQEEVLFILRKNDFLIREKMGICFIPGHLTCKLPNFFKNKLVTIVYPLEEKIKRKITSYGYSIGISALKCTCAT